MKLISKSKYVHRYFDETQSMLISKWQEETEFMHEALYKKEMLNVIKAVKKYKPTLFMVYAQEFKFVIAPELQIWTSSHIAKPIACLGVTKFAYLVPKEYISSISVEQTIYEANDCKTQASYELRYFRHEQDALDWLLKKETIAHQHNHSS